VRTPTRGFLGRGLKYVAGFSYNFGGLIRIKTKGRILELQPTERKTKIKKVTKVRKQITGTEVQMLFPDDRIEVKEDNLEWGKLTIELARGVPPRKFSSPHWYDATSFRLLLNSVQDKTQTIGEVLATIFGPYSVDDFSPDILAMLEKKHATKSNSKTAQSY